MIAVFHLYILQEVEKVTLHFSNQPKIHKDVTISLTCDKEHGANGKYWKSELIFFDPDEVKTLRYKYIVNYPAGFFSNAFDETTEAHFRREIYGGNNCDVFRKPDNHKDNEWIFEGQFFYVKMFYSCVNEENLKKMMIECEHVGFANPNSTLDKRMSFFEWVASTARSLTPSKSAYICALLGQFLNNIRCRYSLGEYLPNSTKTADALLLELHRCHKEHLTTTSLHFIKSIDNNLLHASSHENTLGYILYFGHLFDETSVINFVKKNLVPCIDEKDFNEISSKIVERLMRCKDKDELNTFFTFVISESPSVDCLFKLCRVLETNNCLTDLVEPVVCKFIHMFFTRAIKSDLLETPVWKDVPNALKPKLAIHFCDAVAKQLETRTSSFDYAVLKDLILDKYLQEWATTNVVKLLRVIASSRCKGLPDVTCEALNTNNFHSFWDNMDLKDKESIIQKLLSNKMQAKKRVSHYNKEKVVGAFQVLQEISEIPAIKQCEELMESIGKCVCQDTQRLGINAIVEAYDDIQSSSKEITRQWYMRLLTLTVEQQQACKNDVKLKLKLIEVVQSSSPFTSSSQSIEIDRQVILNN